MTTGTLWRLRGDVMEACSCTVSCPCNFGSDPSQLPCDAVVGWRIQQGNYGAIRLDGLNVVGYLRMPGNAFEGNWTLGVYLDERASSQQVDALGSIFSGQAGGWPAALGALIGNPLPPKQVPINFETVNGEPQITVPGLLEVGSEQVPNPMQGLPPLDTKVTGLAVPFYTATATVRRARVLKLTDPNLSFEYSGRSSLNGPFEYSGP